MSGDFAGSTAEAYRRFRRDVPGPVVDGLLTCLGVRPTDRAIDLGAGTGQVAVPLAARLAGVLAVDPEPDLLDASSGQLRPLRNPSRQLG